MNRHVRSGGFTLVELIVSLAIIIVLAALGWAGIVKVGQAGKKAYCAGTLRQLGAAAHLYISENNGRIFRYLEDVDGGRMWYYGFESAGSLSGAEGEREIDKEKGPLGRYLGGDKRIGVCPAFPYNQSFQKPKYAGASYGYGFNVLLGPPAYHGKAAPPQVHLNWIENPAQVILFGDCAQVNNFQAPASPTNPLLEEFYILDASMKTVHFRHGGTANMLFLDGHVEAFPILPSALDKKLPEANVGKFADMQKYLGKSYTE
jgi:prepilin-type processing-associated H-X9-DG protein